MNMIERAGRQLGLTTAKSLVEKAADRLGQPETETASGAPPSPGVPAAAVAETVDHGRRETRRQIAINFDHLRTKGFALPGDETSVAEEFRLVKRPLLGAAFSRLPSPVENPNLIMVTSANPHEGKTFVATNLAFSIASEHEKHVLLIDADVAKPSVPAVLGFEADAGLTDVVADASLDLAEVMIRTNIPNLTILSSGRARPGASELLASARMENFVEDIAKRYPDRIIIFDSPPVLARSEPIVLAKHVGQIVFVVEAERTTRASINEALRLIASNKLGGVVLNKAPPTPLQEGFGQHYGYYSR